MPKGATRSGIAPPPPPHKAGEQRLMRSSSDFRAMFRSTPLPPLPAVAGRAAELAVALAVAARAAALAAALAAR